MKLLKNYVYLYCHVTININLKSLAISIAGDFFMWQNLYIFIYKLN